MAGGNRKMTDAEAAAFYAKAENQAPAPGAVARRRTKPALTTHVPVRFPPETIERVRVLAEEDGRTVSSWIRRAVDCALDAPSLSVGTGTSTPSTWKGTMTVAGNDVRGLIADAIQFRLPAFLGGHTDQALYVAAGKCAEAVIEVLETAGYEVVPTMNQEDVI